MFSPELFLFWSIVGDGSSLISEEEECFAVEDGVQPLEVGDLL